MSFVYIERITKKMCLSERPVGCDDIGNRKKYQISRRILDCPFPNAKNVLLVAPFAFYITLALNPAYYGSVLLSVSTIS